jgi:hypothetical protein
MMQLIVTVLVFYVIIRAIDGFSLTLGGRDEADKRRRDKGPQTRAFVTGIARQKKRRR